MERVIVAQKANDKLIEKLKMIAEPVLMQEGDLETLEREIGGAVAIILGTWLKFDRGWIDKAPNLKVISRTGVGVDNVDAAYAAERDILVLNTPKANAVSVAEHTVSLICALAKFIGYLDRQVRNDNFKARRLYLPVDLDGKTLGLLGYGNIGRMVAKKCRYAFNMKVLAYDPFVKEADEYVTLVSDMDEVYKDADFLSVHLPLLPETKDLINKDAIDKMKDGAFIVNTSRGGIVNETALIKAIGDGKFAGAGLDVFENEPPGRDSDLLKSDKILLTPHSAALTKECVLRVAECAFDGVIDYLQGKTPEFIYNRK